MNKRNLILIIFIGMVFILTYYVIVPKNTNFTPYSPSPAPNYVPTPTDNLDCGDCKG